MYQEIVTSFRSRCQVVSTELVPPVVIVPSAKSQFPSLGRKLYRHNVRDYAIFRSDFKHAVDSRYSKRDGISLLRTSLQGRPLDLIKGIGTDYDAAWSYLDSVYGDPRFVADTITRTSLSSDLFAMEKMLGFVIWCTLCKEVLSH